MNSHLNHLAAMERSADLRRAAERARLERDDSATGTAGRQDPSEARTIVRMRLFGARSSRLRVRRA